LKEKIIGRNSRGRPRMKFRGKIIKDLNRINFVVMKRSAEKKRSAAKQYFD
jgi:hypothetical protein